MAFNNDRLVILLCKYLVRPQYPGFGIIGLGDCSSGLLRIVIFARHGCLKGVRPELSSTLAHWLWPVGCDFGKLFQAELLALGYASHGLRRVVRETGATLIRNLGNVAARTRRHWTCWRRSSTRR